MRLFTTGTERMRIDSSGNVGIQSTDPTTNSVGGVGGLVIGNGTGNKGLTFFGSSTAQQNIAFTDTSNSQQGLIQYDHGGDYMRLFTTGTERMRIDSSGNLLVGTTDLAPAVSNSEVGVALSGSLGYVAASRSAGASGFFNRLSDGDIVNFNKDGTTVGSVGTDSGDLTIYGTVAGHTGFRFGNGEVYPTNNGGSLSDNTMSLGSTSIRFKDLYLSSGVYLGGTGAANKLDDYEEGTFTSSLRGAGGTPSTVLQATGSYTKIGKTVNFTFAFENITTTGYSGHIYFQGLPFTSSSTVTARTPIQVLTYLGATIDTNAASVTANISSGGSTDIYLYSDRSNNSYATVDHNARNTVYFWVSGTYQTDA
jgi:hypothetical protein